MKSGKGRRLKKKSWQVTGLIHCLGTFVTENPAAAFFILVLNGKAVVADMEFTLFTGQGVLHGKNLPAYRAVCFCPI